MKYISFFILIFTVLDIDASYPESSCGSPINSIPVVESIIKKNDIRAEGWANNNARY